eukprot:scaffold210296_cov52-Attheya_sp.AAC.1
MAMASSSPSSHPFRDPGQPSLSPVSPDLSTDCHSNGKKKRELVQEAFGITVFGLAPSQAWSVRFVFRLCSAKARLSVHAPQSTLPEERLEYWGIKKCKLT